MPTIRAYSLAISAFFLLACSDDSEGLLTAGPQPGQLTGPCIESLCLSGLQCFSGKCHVVPGGSNSASATAPEDPTSAGETTGVVSEGGVTEGGVTEGVATTPTTGDPPDTSTGVDVPTTNDTTTTTTTTGVDTTTVGPDDPSTTWDSSDDSRGFIVPPDMGDGTCGGVVCQNNEQCVLVGEELTCLATCDPLNQAFCGLDYVCVPQEDLFVCAPDASGNTGKVGDGCAYSNGCDPGNTCLTGQYVANCNGQYCCSAFCDLDLADTCLQYGMECVGWFEQGMAPPGMEDIGVCILP